MVFGILRFAHFAHGDLMTLGAYLAFVFVMTAGLPMPLAFLFAAIGTAAAAVVLDQTLYRRLRRSPPVILLISSFGVALILRSLIQLIWGPSTLVYESGIQLPVRIAGLRIKEDHFWIVGGGDRAGPDAAPVPEIHHHGQGDAGACRQTRTWRG